jgi:hypothetical protein
MRKMSSKSHRTPSAPITASSSSHITFQPFPFLIPLHIETPLIESGSINHKVSQSIWLKMESAQASVSFKTGGIDYACEEYLKRRAKHFIASFTRANLLCSHVPSIRRTAKLLA